MSTEMKELKSLASRELKVPEGVQVLLEGKRVTVKGKLGTLNRDFSKAKVQFGLEGNILKITTQKKGRKGDSLLGTIKTKVQNMIRGVNDRYMVKMKVVHSHFPTTVKKEGNSLRIDNFMGERSPRRVAIPKGVEVDVKGPDIVLSGIDKDDVTQLAGAVQSSTRIARKDPRVYLDGIYVVKKRYESEFEGEQP